MSTLTDLDNQVAAAEKSVEDLKRRASELNSATTNSSKESESMGATDVPVDKPSRIMPTAEKPNYMMRNILVLGVIAFAAVMLLRKK